MSETEMPDTASSPVYTLWQLVVYFLKLGTIGFGGPVALVGYMHRDLVEQRGWISEMDYKEGMTLSQLAPGPLAAQLAIYLGYVHYHILGATLVGVAFVIPSFFMVLGIGWAYVEYGGLPWMQAVFYGVGAAVIGIITMSAKKLTEKSIGKDKLLWAIYLLLATITVITKSEIASLFIAAGKSINIIANCISLRLSRPHGFTESLCRSCSKRLDCSLVYVLVDSFTDNCRGFYLLVFAAFPILRRLLIRLP